MDNYNFLILSSETCTLQRRRFLQNNQMQKCLTTEHDETTKIHERDYEIDLPTWQFPTNNHYHASKAHGLPKYGNNRDAKREKKREG